MKTNKKRGAPKKENPGSEKISFRVEPEMKETLAQMAKEDERSLRNYVKKILREAVNQ